MEDSEVGSLQLDQRLRYLGPTRLVSQPKAVTDFLGSSVDQSISHSPGIDELPYMKAGYRIVGARRAIKKLLAITKGQKDNFEKALLLNTQVEQQWYVSVTSLFARVCCALQRQ